MTTRCRPYLMIEKGILGGISQYVKWYSKSNNEYLKDYDTTKTSHNTTYENYLLNVVADNLYVWALSQNVYYRDLIRVDPSIPKLDEWKHEILKFKEDKSMFIYILKRFRVS